MKTLNRILLLALVLGFAVPALAAETAGQTLRLSRANVPVDIPLHQGFFDAKPVYYIITDSSDEKHAELITKQQGWRVELAPVLSHIRKESLAPVYLFMNGSKGGGIHGFQDEVFPNTPAQADRYSAVRSVVHVTWKEGSQPQVLGSEAAILSAKAEGRVEFEETPAILNMPQIRWPGGEMPIRKGKTLSDESPYGDGQVLDIDTKNMKVTFVAHRGWGPEGKTIYYIVTDAAPSEPAKMMGVVFAPTVAKTIESAAAQDLFQFANGIKGSGPMGFQAGIAIAAPGDSTYSPLWKISMVEWRDPSKATLLETRSDITDMESRKAVTVSAARPMDSDHVVNCPFISPFQTISVSKKLTTSAQAADF